MKASASQIARVLQQRARSIERAALKAERQALAEANKVAMSLSEGPYSLQVLAKMGHPYAKRAPNPPMHPGIINIQSGKFRDNWTAEGPFSTGNGVRCRLRNATPYAKYLDQGTSKMIRRPIRQLIVMRIRARHRENLRKAIIGALKGNR